MPRSSAAQTRRDRVRATVRSPVLESSAAMMGGRMSGPADVGAPEFPGVTEADLVGDAFDGHLRFAESAIVIGRRRFCFES